MPTKFAFLPLSMILAVGGVSAQAPTPVVVQAAPAAPATAALTVPAGPAAATDSPLTALQELKAANEDILKKQAATLLQLEEIQKAVEQLKIYSKRG